MDPASVTITLHELIASGHLDAYTFSFRGENENEIGVQSSIEKDSSSSLYNAVKISLLLAKEFARCDSIGAGDHLSSLQLESICVELSTSGFYSCFNGENGQKENNYNCFLLSVMLNPTLNRHDLLNSNGMESKLQHLGRLIYAIFSRNKKLPYPTEGATQSLEANNSTDSFSVSSKYQKGEEVSLFSKLMEMGDFSVPVCRMLSDMIDTGTDGRADFPFHSFEEVVQDLEQMSLHPNIFLHNADADFKLFFGQRYYGHKKEMSQLLSVSTVIEQSAKKSGSTHVLSPAETVFVKGVAGAGKTHMVQRVSDFLSTYGCWIVAKTKFERGTQHESRQRVSLLFDSLIASIVAMRDGGNERDVEYSLRATKAITDAIDRSSLVKLTEFIPRIRDLINECDRGASPTLIAQKESKSWQLAWLLSKLISALLSLDRFVLLHLDDIQWCDPLMFALVNEVIIHSGNHRQRCLCVSTYRPKEVSGIHPLMMHYKGLKANRNVNVTDIELSSLNRQDVMDMIMTELRLPERLVVDITDVIHKKTSGLAIFVVQLLNSLVRDGTIAYSPRLHRHNYDLDRLDSIKTLESVASLIVSNLSSLPDVDQQNLRIICCFGMQSHLSILSLVKDCPGVQSVDLHSSLGRLVRDGILELERVGKVVKFSHDIIYLAVTSKMSPEERSLLQFKLGTFLGAKAALDTDRLGIEETVKQLNLGERERTEDVALASAVLLIAVDLINNASSQIINNQLLCVRYAGWNLRAASAAKDKSNFEAALHYCKKGISLLGKDPWSQKSSKLCRELHEAAAFASHAIRDPAGINLEDPNHFAEAVIQNVPFEESLFAQLMILRSLESAGEHEDTIARGLSIVRALNFDIPSNPTPSNVAETMIETEKNASKYSIEDIINIQKSTVVDSMKRNILNIIGGVMVACYQTGSPFFSLVTCALVNYSLNNGIVCEESAAAFSTFGFFRIIIQEKYDSGKHWGNVAEEILAKSRKPHIRASLVLYGWLFLWSKPLNLLSRKLMDLYDTGMKIGEVDSAMWSILQSWRFSFYRGNKLSELALSYSNTMNLMVKYSKAVAKYAVLDISLTYELMGKSDDPYSYFEGAFSNGTDLFREAKRKKNNQQLQSIAYIRFVSAFHSGNYTKAARLSEKAWSYPTSKTPKIQLIFHCFYQGLTSFRMYRDGHGESHLEEGKKMLDKMELWHPHSPCTFENKLQLLQAEYEASQCKRSESIKKYEDAAKAARDNGFVHEQGLALEFMGDYLSSIVELVQATECYTRAYECYQQWGAVAKAKKIKDDHNLVFISESEAIDHNSLKHGRNW